jgi:hypothetical protein
MTAAPVEAGGPQEAGGGWGVMSEHDLGGTARPTAAVQA